MTKKSNRFFSKKVTNIISSNKVKKILIEDIFESSKIEFLVDKNSNTILYLETSNRYHNIFFKHVTYLISKENNLMRLESLKRFDRLKLNDEYFQNSYIDILEANIEVFEINQLKNNDNAYSIIIKKENKEAKIFGTLRL